MLGEGLVGAFLGAAVAGAPVCEGARAGGGHLGDRVGVVLGLEVGVVGDAHVVEAVSVVDVGIVEPGAVAGFPAGGADHAELSCAAAGHVIAALL